MDDDALVGHVIDGRFRLERMLGMGGMGRVYAAKQLSVGRDVAVKVLRSDLSGLETLQRRFFQEAQLIASLRHPNIVSLVDFGHDEQLGALYIVMEYVAGRSLTDVLQRGRLPLVLSLAICRQICSGLAEAHAAGIVHRDLKPDNVMLQLTAEGRLSAKLLDFGIALPQGRDETRFTATGAVLGTPHYMSPEQARDQPVTERSDLYSLGVILYEAIAGAPPFHADTPLALLFKTVNERHTPISVALRGEDLPPGGVADLLDELLAKEPAERPATAADLGRRIDSLLDALSEPVPVLASLDDLDEVMRRTTPRYEPGSLDVGSTASDGEPPPPVKAGTSLAPVLAVALFVLLALVVVGAVAGALIWASLSRPEKVAEEPTPAIARPAVMAAPMPPAEPRVQAAPAPPEPVVRAPTNKGKSKKKKPPKPPKPKKSRETAESNEREVCQRNTCDVTLRTRGGSAVCQGSDTTCEGDCPRGGCTQTCQGASCRFECSGGDCRQQCMGDATCTLSCSGGDCSRFTPGGKVTELD